MGVGPVEGGVLRGTRRDRLDQESSDPRRGLADKRTSRVWRRWEYAD